MNYAESWFQELYKFITFMEIFLWFNVYLIQTENIMLCRQNEKEKCTTF